MLLDRPERIGMDPEEALVLLQYRNLKDKFNRYLESFIEFINDLQKIKYQDKVEVTPLKELVNLYNQSEDEKRFITALVYEFQPNIDELLEKKLGKNSNVLARGNPNRALFSEETTRKVMNRLNLDD